MSEWDEEDLIDGTEQENKGQQIDPFGVAKDVNDINNRINQSVEQNKPREVNKNSSNQSNLDTNSKTPDINDNVKNSIEAGKQTGVDTIKTNEGVEKTADIGKNSTTDLTPKPTPASQTGGAAGTEAAAGGLPLIVWILIALCGLVLLIFIFLAISNVGSALSLGTGADSDIIAGECEKGDDKACELATALYSEDSNLGDSAVYEKLVDYCDDQTSFFTKIKEKISILLTGNMQIEDPCQLVRYIDDKVKKQEEKTKLDVSRGLVISTLQLLLDSKEVIDSTEEVDEKGNGQILSPLDPLKVLININNNVKNGFLKISDLDALINYIIYEESYTYYTWQEVDRKIDIPTCKVYNAETNEYFECKTKIVYGCRPSEYNYYSNDPKKFLMFLRFGGGYNEENDNWEESEVDRETNNGFIKSTIFDAALQFQELTSYNIALKTSSTECVTGEYTLPKEDDNYTYGVDESSSSSTSISTAMHAFPFKEPIDTTGYEDLPDITSDENYEKTKVMGIKGNCKLNNIKWSDTNLCNETEEYELNYFNGFIFTRFPLFLNNINQSNGSIDDINEDEYNIIAKGIEKEIVNIDSYEDYLNEIFGFDPQIGYMDMNYYQGISTSSSCLYQNKSVRLHTPDPSTYKLPGGSSYINGTYVANETISLDEYVKSVTLGELRGLITQQNIESVKFMMVAIKSYALRNGDEKDGELYYKADSNSFQSYRPLSSASSEQRAVLESAYSSVKDILLYEKGTEKVFNALYGSKLQKLLAQYAQEGKKYEEMLTLDGVSNYGKVHYSGAEFKNCSTTLSSGGIYSGNVDTKWPFFPEGTNYRVSTYSMFICRKMDSGRADFHAAVDLPVNAGTQITCPIDGVVISKHYWDCGNGVIQVRGTIPGTSETVILQFTHLSDRGLISNGSVVSANQTVIGYTSDGRNDECSSGSHLDFKVYNAATKRYYNPSVFVAGILSGSTNIPLSPYIVDYNGGDGPSGYDVCCEGRIGNFPQC